MIYISVSVMPYYYSPFRLGILPTATEKKEKIEFDETEGEGIYLLDLNVRWIEENFTSISLGLSNWASKRARLPMNSTWWSDLTVSVDQFRALEAFRDTIRTEEDKKHKPTSESS